MFKADQCDLCGDCIVKCQWIEADQEQAVKWMQELIDGENSEMLSKCITCYACNEICPRQANPFDRIAELQEKYNALVPADAVAGMEPRYVFEGELRDMPKARKIMTTCVFGKSEAALIEGALYDLPRIGGKPYFCWILFSHMGAESIQHKHARTLVDRLSQTGAEEIVCFHDDCYAMLATLAPAYGISVPFRPVHLTEHIVSCLKGQEDALRRLDMPIAYQRPCASRHTPEKENFVDAIFELAGVKRVERQYDRENALCCGGVKLMFQQDPEPDQIKNVRDAKAAGAKAIVYMCPMCRNSLLKAAMAEGLPLIFIGDIARMALGEIDAPL